MQFAKPGHELLAMAPNIKYFLWLVGFLLISFWCQGSLDSASNSMASQESIIMMAAASQRGLETSATTNLRKEQRTPIREDEFWLIETDIAELPFEVDFTPPDDSYGNIKPLWSCDDPNASEGRAKKLVFVNVVRTEALDVLQLLSSYASSCHAGFVSTVMCSGLSFESMKDVWANRKVARGSSAVRCPLQNDSIDRKGEAITGYKYVTDKALRKTADILAGQVPLGSHEQWKKDMVTVDAQYVVSLRSPYAWFISSIVDKAKMENGGETIVTDDTIIAAIKEKVETDLDANIYHEIYARYLITPAQISWIQKEDAELNIENRVELSLTNLKNSNAVIILSEHKAESLDKLAYLIDAKGHQKEAFVKAKQQVEEQLEGNQAVERILKKLTGDTTFFPKLEEYMKYEGKIYEQAKVMHERQVAWLRTNHPNLS